MKRERGVALITVLLIVAIVTVVTAALVARQHLAIRSSANQLNARQALHYAMGGEALAQGILLRDIKGNSGDPRSPVDHLGEAWARPLPPFAIEQGEIAVRISDLSGRFNLNSLVQGKQVNRIALERFQRLQRLLGIERNYAPALVDWLDEDQQVYGEGGAEDNQYLLATPPYRTGGQAMASVSELRLLLGMTEADYRRLLPHVSALPAQTPLNVNTASAPVLASLADGLSLASGRSLQTAGGREGYRDLAAFLGQPALAGLGVQGAGLAVGSQFFEVRSEVRLGERRLVLLSTLQRSAEGEMLVLGRDFGQAALLAEPTTTTEQDPR